jgi:very-short-patch-repair endonuclease
MLSDLNKFDRMEKIMSAMDEEKYYDNLFKGADPSTHDHARELRHSETEAEKILWNFLRNRKLKGKKFRRQHAFADYVLDFYCHECKLAVELDGNVHVAKEAQQYDAARTHALNEYGITVIRFWNNEVVNKPEKVLEKIAMQLY